MNKKLLLIILIVLGTSPFVAGQKNAGYVLWSSSHKFTVEEFAIKTQQVETTLSFGQFTIDYQVHGFDFLTKNFNKRVRNYFIKSASWIDTSTSVNQSLTYQQTLFDICEVYTRRFRKALRENRSKILKGATVAEELNKQFVSDFAKRRVYYDKETKFGTDAIMQKEWEAQILKELTELSAYAYDK